MLRKFSILFTLTIIFNLNLYSSCYTDGSCEPVLTKTSNEIKEVIKNSFDGLNNKISKVKENYQKINTELDKEIYLLNVALKGEALLYRKLSEAELYSKQSKEITSLDISLLTEIINELKDKKVKGKKNVQQ